MHFVSSGQANTSSWSGSEDYYSCYENTPLPPPTGWVPRLPGLSPAAGYILSSSHNTDDRRSDQSEVKVI